MKGEGLQGRIFSSHLETISSSVRCLAVFPAPVIADLIVEGHLGLDYRGASTMNLAPES